MPSSATAPRSARLLALPWCSAASATASGAGGAASRTPARSPDPGGGGLVAAAGRGRPGAALCERAELRDGDLADGGIDLLAALVADPEAWRRRGPPPRGHPSPPRYWCGSRAARGSTSRRRRAGAADRAGHRPPRRPSTR
ncbi:hypothetical protein ACRAWF_36115 [Streptomyces sp. L7]